MCVCAFVFSETELDLSWLHKFFTYPWMKLKTKCWYLISSFRRISEFYISTIENNPKRGRVGRGAGRALWKYRKLTQLVKSSKTEDGSVTFFFFFFLFLFLFFFIRVIRKHLRETLCTDKVSESNKSTHKKTKSKTDCSEVDVLLRPWNMRTWVVANSSTGPWARTDEERAVVPAIYQHLRRRNDKTSSFSFYLTCLCPRTGWGNSGTSGTILVTDWIR